MTRSSPKKQSGTRRPAKPPRRKNPIVQDAKPFSAAETRRITEDVFRDGYRLIPGVLQPGEIAALKDAIDRMFANPRWRKTDNIYNDFVAVRLFECGNIFRDMLVREPIISLVESILGKSCHLMADGVVRNKPGQAIDNFHADVDEVVGVEFPCPPGIPRHDPRYRLPMFRLVVQIPLTDIESVEYGPTEYVPGSHYSGRIPNDSKHPTFEGRGPVPVLCKAGDIYLHHGQTWHRGAPNTSNRRRYLYQLCYSQRWVAQRFYPFLNYKMPARVLKGAEERLLRVLGKHPKGPYG
jgi:ectoine hydroxylase-related dioxygenase (phytanoyl-CoA dioxygenase family)